MSAAPPSLAVSDHNRVARLCYINRDQNLCMMIHGSLSCDEDRLGLLE